MDIPLEIDIAAFARVMTWDPDVEKQMPERAAEFPAELVFSGRELRRENDSFRAPVWGGTACVIGIEWEESRCLRTLALTAGDETDLTDPHAIHVEYWHDYAEEKASYGKGRKEYPGSLWQGEWVPLDVVLEKQGQRLICRMDDAHPCARHGTMKVRWIFRDRTDPLVVTHLSARTLAIWKHASLRIEVDTSLVTGPAAISIYNGGLPAADAPTGPLAWDTGKPQVVDVVYGEAPADRPDARYSNRTLLTLTLPQTTLTVAVEDVLDRGPVYVAYAGVYVSRCDETRDLAAYREAIRDKKTIREQVHEMPDQALGNAMVHRNPCGDSSPILLSLACNNRKSVLLRGGTLITTGFQVDPAYVDPEFFCMSPAFGSERYQEKNAATWTEGWGEANPGRIRRWLHEGWLPIVHNSFVEEPIEYRQCTFVVPLEEAAPQTRAWCGDRRSVCVIEYTIENTGARDAVARLELSFESRSQTPPPGLHEPRAATMSSGEKDTLVLEGEGVRAVVNIEGCGALEVKCEDGAVVLSGALPAGARAACIIYVAEKTVMTTDAVGGIDNARKYQSTTTRYWTDALSSGMTIEVPEALLNNVLRSSLQRQGTALNRIYDDGYALEPMGHGRALLRDRRSRMAHVSGASDAEGL